ncbi:UNVERIFIED_CONTAM: hypothetical protein GTU68_063324 [Idotea baltica]|nr:hypothetical protein [Idotea baltica]
MVNRIFLSAPDVRVHERDYLLNALDSNWIAPAGPHLDQFELELAAETGRSFAVGLASGTAALHLALLAAGVGPGDAVLCSSLTFIGSVSPISYCGARPIFVDSESATWNMDPELLRVGLSRAARAGTLPKAAVVVDLYGVAARYDQIVPLLDEYDIALVEDAAEALGASYKGARCGSFGSSAILSFNGNKIITSGGGGALVTDDEALATRARYLASQARQPAVHYEHTEVGFNYRLSNVSAALGSAQLATLPDRIARRREIEHAYRAQLEPLGMVFLDVDRDWVRNHWLTTAQLKGANAHATRDALIVALEDENIESRPVWKPMHLQPVFADAQRVVNGTSEALFETGICLPTGSGMTDEELDRVINAIKRFLTNRD